jgi:enterochelin esterase-like enzyme
MKILPVILPLLIIQSIFSSIFPIQPAIIATATPQTSLNLTCNEKTGKLTALTLESSVLNRTLEYSVYSPPCYDPAGATSYPVLYLLHGSSASNDQWILLGAQTKADEMISDGKINPFLIVFPREAAYNEDTRTSKYGQAILEELIPTINRDWLTLSGPSHTAIGGLSRGAGWAVHLGLAHPEVFGQVGAHSLALFYADINQIEKWRKLTQEEDLPRLYLDIGLQDYLKDSAKKFEIKLSEYSYPHEWHLNRGTHNAAYWSANLPDYLRWYSQGWED